MTDDPRSHPFRDSVTDLKAAREVPDTAQTRAPAYRLAFADPDFLTRDELRPVRLQLELLKPQMVMDERGIRSTVVLMGSARASVARKRRDRRRAWQAGTRRRASWHAWSRREASKATGATM